MRKPHFRMYFMFDEKCGWFAPLSTNYMQLTCNSDVRARMPTQANVMYVNVYLPNVPSRTDVASSLQKWNLKRQP